MTEHGLHLRRRHRKTRRDEDYIWQYQFPPHIETRCRRDRPEIDDREWKMVEQGLREWFLCCAWREGEVLGMPSRLVDEAWHEFILDSRAYHDFCEGAYGEYLHHSPEATMATPMGDALGSTVRAWDRSSQGRGGEAVLWGLDHLLGLPSGHGLSEAQLEGIRAEAAEAQATAENANGNGGVHHHGGGGEAGSSSEPSGESGGEEAGGEAGGSDSGGSGDSGSGSGGSDSGGGGCGGGCGGGGGGE